MSDATHARDANPGEHAAKGSQDRYEFGEFFAQEGSETQHFLQVCGVVLLFVILGVLIGWPLRYWPTGTSADAATGDAVATDDTSAADGDGASTPGE